MIYQRLFRIFKYRKGRDASDLVFRLTKYKTAKYADDVDELWKLFFKGPDGKPDLHASVYSFSPIELDIPRIKAEHTAFSRINPESKGSLEISGAIKSFSMRSNRDGGCFTYREDHHYEIVSGSAEEVKAICRTMLQMNIPKNAQSITEKSVISGHVRQAINGTLGNIQQEQWQMMSSSCGCNNKSECKLNSYANGGRKIPIQGCDIVKKWIDKIK